MRQAINVKIFTAEIAEGAENFLIMSHSGLRAPREKGNIK